MYKWHYSVGAFIIAVVLLLGTTATQGYAGPSSEGNGSQKPPRKILVFQGSFRDRAAQDALLASLGAVKIKDLSIINGKAVYLPLKAELALRSRPEVLRIEDDAFIQALPEAQGAKGQPGKPAPAPQPVESLPWGVNRIDADLVWPTGNTGAGVKVSTLDTGIDLNHPDLVANIKGSVNVINPNKSAMDDNGHGTHVAGTIAAVDNDIGVIGVGPDTYLYAVKWLDRNGFGFLSDFIEAVQWSRDNGMQVVNMSVGWSSDYQSIHDALIAAYNSGLVLVAAAGNSGPGDNTVGYPAKYAEVIAVAATCQSGGDVNGWCSGVDSVASFSSRGPDVELAAPGAYVPSTWKGGGYNTISGTSMATPHVVGAAALVIKSGLLTDLNGDGKIDNVDVRLRLQSTSDDLGAAGRDNAYGYGLVDAQEAATGVQTLP
ncbi:MAG: S8 family peptidase [Chloroflexi bacterium]|nr:S8 family peptidase [Chloroflexota bacterium]